MKKTLAITLGIFLVMFVSGIISAEEIVVTQNTYSGTAYGQCVSQHTVIKNTCFESSKTLSNGCKSIAKEAGNKLGMKQCKQVYKEGMKQCKATFKANKAGCKSIRDAAEATQ